MNATYAECDTFEILVAYLNLGLHGFMQGSIAPARLGTPVLTDMLTTWTRFRKQQKDIYFQSRP